MSVAKEAGTIDAAAETTIQNMVRDAYAARIDDCVNNDDYETALSLIGEGNEKLNVKDFDSRLSEIPDAVSRGVHFDNKCIYDSMVLFYLY